MAFETNIIICTIDGNENCSEVGFVKVRQNANYADVRKAIELDELDGLEGHEFVFLGQRKLPLSKRQEERYKVTEEEVFVRVNECQEDFQPLKRRRLVIHELQEEEDVAATEVVDQTRANEEKASLSLECEGRMHSKFASRAVTCRWIHTYRKYKSKMKSQGKKDRFELMSSDVNGVGVFSIWCVECQLKYGRGGDDMFYNFTARHMESKEHKLNLQRNSESVVISEESASKDKSESEIMAENRAEVEECMASKVAPFVEQSGVMFELYRDTLRSYANKEEICIICVVCKRSLLLFPSRGDVVDNMKEHVKSSRHAQKSIAKERNEEDKMHEQNKHGRPRKEIVDASQKSMLSFFTRDQCNEAGPSHPNETSRNKGKAKIV